MSAEVKRPEIANLPHYAKIAYAARCARIIYDLVSPLLTPPAELRDALCSAERWGGDIAAAQEAVRQYTGEEQHASPGGRPIHATIERLQAPQAGSCADAIARAVLCAWKAALNNEAPARRDEYATGMTEQAYRDALIAASEAATRLMGIAHAQATFRAEARRSLDRLLKRPNPAAGATPPEFFTSPDDAS